MSITVVWIEDGCIACSACETICPEVFVMTGDAVAINAAARIDNVMDGNRSARSPLTPASADLADRIEEAAEGCPVEVIRFS